MRRAEVNLHGHSVSYLDAGTGDDVVLLVHGVTGSSATWAPVIPALADRVRVLAPDLPGHGASDKPRGDYSLGAYASGLRDLLERLGCARVTVVGHSLGGGIALQFAYQFYENCDRVVLVSSGGLGAEVSWLLRAATLPGSELVLPLLANRHVHDAGVAMGRALRRALPLRFRPSVTEAMRGFASLADSHSRAAFLHTLRSVIDVDGQRVSAHDRLYLADGLPTLIVWGALDTIIPARHGYAAHESIPGSRLEVFEQSGHFPFQDEPDRFARLLLEFLRDTRPGQLDRAQMQARLARPG